MNLCRILFNLSPRDLVVGRKNVKGVLFHHACTRQKAKDKEANRLQGLMGPAISSQFSNI